MSEEVQVESIVVDSEEKSDDKKEIEEEEREKMLNEENKKDVEEEKGNEEEDKEVKEEKEEKEDKGEKEKEKEKTKRGRLNIKVPDFLRMKSRERSKEKDPDPEEGKDLLGKEGEKGRAEEKEDKKEIGEGLSRLANIPRVFENIKVTNPFTKKQKEGQQVEIEIPEQEEGVVEEPCKKETVGGEEGAAAGGEHKESAGATRKTRLLEAIRLPLVSVFPRKSKASKEKASEAGDADTVDKPTDKEQQEATEGEEGEEKIKKDPTETAGEDNKEMEEKMEVVKVESVEKLGDPEEAEKQDPEKGSRKSGTTDATAAAADTSAAGAAKQDWRERIVRMARRHRLLLGGAIVFVLLVIIIIAIAASGPRPEPDWATKNRVVDGRYVNTITSCGKVQGLVEDNGLVFRGIPYAVPPVGKRRWKTAEGLQELRYCWNGTHLAHNFSTPCWQKYRNGSYDGAEDCLTLDVYTPKVGYDTPLPVVVVIAGETLAGGQAWQQASRPSAKLAKEKNMVFVYVNYRMNVLGFLALDMLTRNVHPPHSGNYGLTDIVQALKWVNLNIENFGGNSSHVTILGHQAGATLAAALTASRKSKKLFSQVWITNGAAVYSNKTLKEVEMINDKYLSSIECTDITCLYDSSPEELIEVVPDDWNTFPQDLPEMGQQPHEWAIIDGAVLTDNPYNIWQAHINNEKNYSIVIGTTSHAEAFGAHDSYTKWSRDYSYKEYVEMKLRSFNGSVPPLALQRYQKSNITEWLQYITMVSDIKTICPLYNLASSSAKHFNRVYFYVARQTRYTTHGDEPVADGASDIAAILGNYRPATESQKKFVRNMQQLFYGFVKNSELTLDKRMGRHIYLVDQDIQTDFQYPNCEFWREFKIVPDYSRVD